MTAAIDRTQWARLGDTLRPVSFLGPLLALVVLQRLFFPAPLGIVVNGALVGGRIALIALGIALVYRANRIINFAQGDLGAVPATLGVMLVVAWTWSYWFGLLVGLAASILLGVLVESLIIRRFFTAPRLMLTVATIGISQVLAGAALFLPRAFGDTSFGNRLPQPFDAEFRIDPVTFNANDIFTMIVVPVCLVLLALFLQRSQDRRRHRRLRRAGRPGLHARHPGQAPAHRGVGGRLGARLPGHVPAGGGGGSADRRGAGPAVPGPGAGGRRDRPDRALRRHRRRRHRPRHRRPGHDLPGLGNRPAYNDAVLFVIVLVGLLRRAAAAGRSRVDSDASATWQATREIRPMPRELRRLPEVVWGAGPAAGRSLGAFVLSLPLWLSTSRINLATIIVIFGIVAASLVVLTGWAGQVSLGQMAFVGRRRRRRRGADRSPRSWDLALAMLVAGLVGAVAAVVVGYPALRRRGLTLAVSTLAFGLFVSSYLLNRTVYPINIGGLEIPDWLPARRIDRGSLLGIDVSSETACSTPRWRCWP